MINFKGKDAKIIEGKKHYSIKINELESFLTRSSKDIANKGYPFNKVQLNDIKDFDNTNLYASINVKLNDKRKKIEQNILQEINSMVDDLAWDIDRMSQSGRKTYTNLTNYLDNL